jgi:hypothetical protein
MPGQHYNCTGIPSRVTAIPTTSCGRNRRHAIYAVTAFPADDAGRISKGLIHYRPH